jgi:hypothetical protein
VIGLIKVKREPFFFEKKHQKTFVNLGNGGFTSTDERSKVFLVPQFKPGACFFFKKRTASLT